jgi:hypothetical protein
MDWKSIVGAVAPTLATALGGPLAGMAASAVSEALLGKPNGSEGEIVTALKAGGPNALLKLKEADQQFAKDMRRMDIDVEKLHAEDRNSARQANVAGGIQGRVFILVLTIIAAVIGIEAAVLFYGIPASMDGQIAGRVLGTLDAVLMAAVFYVFGSSAGSTAKTEILGRAKA